MSSYLRVRSHALASVLSDIAAERYRQDEKWGQQDLPDGTGPDTNWVSIINVAGSYRAEDLAGTFRRRCQQRFAEGTGTWADVALEEFAEALAEDDPVKLRAELVQEAAVRAAWIEAIDRRLAAQ